MVPVCQRDAAKVNPFGLYNAFGIRRLRNRILSNLYWLIFKVTARPMARCNNQTLGTKSVRV